MDTLDEADDDAPVNFSAARKPEDCEMDITPMIDMVFQLLIFFMVCGKVGEAVSVKLPKSSTGFMVPTKESVVLIVKHGGGDSVQVLNDKGVAFSNDPAAQEQEITAYVEAGLNGAAPFSDKKQEVLVRAEGTVKSREVARVAKAAARAAEGELERIHIGVLEVRGEE